MKKVFFYLIFFFSCSPATTPLSNASFDDLDFTFDSGWKVAYSMRLDKNGLAIIKIGRWGKEYQKGTLSANALSSLDSLLNIIPFEKYDTAYRTNIVDQVSYKIVVSNFKSPNKRKSVFVYGDTAPALIKELSNKIQKIKTEISFSSVDTSISFLSEQNFYPPGYYLIPLGVSH